MTDTTYKNGQVSFTIGGTDYTVLPNVKAILAIEQATGKPILQVGMEAMSLGLTINATVLYQALRANGVKELSFEDVAEAMLEDMQSKDQALFKASLAFLNGIFPKIEPTGGKPKSA
jgi:hypothetical protein